MSWKRLPTEFIERLCGIHWEREVNEVLIKGIKSIYGEAARVKQMEGKIEQLKIICIITSTGT